MIANIIIINNCIELSKIEMDKTEELTRDVEFSFVQLESHTSYYNHVTLTNNETYTHIHIIIILCKINECVYKHNTSSSHIHAIQDVEATIHD